MAVFAQHPLSLYLTDKRRKRHYPRTAITLQFALLYSLGVGIAFLLSLMLAPSLRFVLPLLLVVPFALFQLESKTRHQGRSIMGLSWGYSNGWSFTSIIAAQSFFFQPCNSTKLCFY
jgi:hypothetical protein